jgi:hypothetical protein
MVNLSLARIMYGTHEDFHASSSMNNPGFPSPQTYGKSSFSGTEASSESSMLGKLLHRAWAALNHKD